MPRSRTEAERGHQAHGSRPVGEILREGLLPEAETRHSDPQRQRLRGVRRGSAIPARAGE